MISFSQFIAEQASASQVTDDHLKKLEHYADCLFNAVGVDIEFSKHFKERVRDPRNGRPITIQELIRLWTETRKKYGTRIANMKGGAEAVLRDMQTDINVPFALEWDSKRKELDLIAKTIMRKKNFLTPNKKLEID